MKSLLPPGVNVLAMTATATRTIRLSVSRTLGLNKPFVIARSPCKRNLLYSVGTFSSGRSFSVCADVYLFIRDQLGSGFTEPHDAPDIPKFRLCDMFTSVTDPRHKTQIIDLFTRESNLRVVIGTIAFGMGIDCPDVRQIVHIGLPDDA